MLPGDLGDPTEPIEVPPAIAHVGNVGVPLADEHGEEERRHPGLQRTNGAPSDLLMRPLIHHLHHLTDDQPVLAAAETAALLQVLEQLRLVGADHIDGNLCRNVSALIRDPPRRHSEEWPFLTEHRVPARLLHAAVQAHRKTIKNLHSLPRSSGGLTIPTDRSRSACDRSI